MLIAPLAGKKGPHDNLNGKQNVALRHQVRFQQFFRF